MAPNSTNTPNPPLLPQLRFPEFEGEWEQNTLANFTCDARYGLNRKAVEFDGNNKYLRITDINEESRAFVPNPLCSPEGVVDEEFVLRESDIVFARTGASVGKCYLYRKDDGRLLYAGFLIKFTVRNNTDAFFLYSYTFTWQYKKWVIVMSARSGQPGINSEEFKSLRLPFPTLPEQQKIADFLSAVDKKIQQLTRKKELLEQYKKGAMQKIFSQELRFKDEAGKEYLAWEEKRLGDISSMLKGKGISKENIDIDGNQPCIRYGELYTIYDETISEIKSYTSVQNNQFVLGQKNDVLIPSSGETHIDIATASCLLVEQVALGGDINIVRSLINGIFLAYYLSSARRQEIARLAQGNSVVHLYASHLKTLELLLPNVLEQQKIANFLTSLDQKISHIDTQITQTQEFKRGLLQKMFV